MDDMVSLFVVHASVFVDLITAIGIGLLWDRSELNDDNGYDLEYLFAEIRSHDDDDGRMCRFVQNVTVFRAFGREEYGRAQ